MARRATIHRRYPSPSRAAPITQRQLTSAKLSYPSTTSTKSLYPPSPTTITTAQPIHPASATIRYHRPKKSTSQPPTTRTMAPALPIHSPTQVSQKCWPLQISHILRSRHSLSRGRRSHPRQISNHFLRGCYHKLVFQAPARLHLLLATTERELHAQLSRVPNGARLRRRFSVVHSKRERNTPQFLPKVFIDEGPSLGGI
jgi:hypothetical protein